MVTANGCLSRTVHTATSGLLARGSGGEYRHRLLQGYQPGAVFPGPFRFRPGSPADPGIQRRCAGASGGPRPGV